MFIKIPKEYIDVVKPHLTYESEYWQSTPRGKKRVKYDVCLCPPNGMVLRGFQKRIEDIIDYKFPESKTYFKTKSLEINGIELNTPQKRLVRATIANDMGILTAPTGMGKTVIASGMVSIFRNYKILFLCHKIDLVMQTANEFDKLLGITPKILGGGIKELDRPGNVCVSTVQSAIKQINMFQNYDIIIVDECHHCSKRDGQFWKFLLNIKAVKRFGLTATLPFEKSKRLIMEGLLGGVIGEITHQEGIEQGRLTDVNIIMIPIKNRPPYGCSWQVASDFLVRNMERTDAIVRICIEKRKANESVLIMVKFLEHGKVIEKALKKAGFLPKYVSGNVSIDEREQAKKTIDRKGIVITTNIFDEGVNIPSLNNIVIASGGKSDLNLLQKIGRGIRTFEGKKCINIFDFHDSGKYLKKHADARIEVYIKKGWL